MRGRSLLLITVVLSSTCLASMSGAPQAPATAQPPDPGAIVDRRATFLLIMSLAESATTDPQGLRARTARLNLSGADQEILRQELLRFQDIKKATESAMESVRNTAAVSRNAGADDQVRAMADGLYTEAETSYARLQKQLSTAGAAQFEAYFRQQKSGMKIGGARP